MTSSPSGTRSGVPFHPTHGDVLRLESQVGARDEVIRQLNRRLVELELGRSLLDDGHEDKDDADPSEVYQHRLTVLEQELRHVRAALRAAEAESDRRLLELETIRSVHDRFEQRRAVRWIKRLERVRAAVGRLSAR
jgi:hypothetical protein